MPLLERDGLLAQLHAQWTGASAGPGRLIFIEGEAGIGKTSLLRAFAQSVAGEAPVYWGACEAMQTPRPLGPLEDIAASAGGALAALQASGAPRLKLFVAFVDLLAERPMLVLLEDLHWADEATLDLLRYAGRRVARTRSLLLASFRSDELVPAHPLRPVLGDLATTGALRLAPQPLSLDAVRTLAGDRAIATEELHRRTGGNPFFVTEVLASGERGVPATVQDAVLARAARLRPSARAVLDAAAVAGPRVEPRLLHELTAAESASIDECLATGVLCVEEGAFVFRHELARQAVLQVLAPTRAMTLHRLALLALLGSRSAQDATRAGEQAGAERPVPQGAGATPSGINAARLLHHAEAAGEADAVRYWAPIAAQAATARGAHRQAAAHLASAAKVAPDSAARAALLDDYAAEAQMAGGLTEAIEARHAAAQLWRAVRDSGREAATLGRLALLHHLAGRNAEGEAALRDALALTAADVATPEAFTVRRCVAAVRMLDSDFDEALALGLPVLAEAERTDDGPSIIEVRVIIGAALLNAGREEEGIAHMERGFALAQQLGKDRLAGLALTNLGAGCGVALMLDAAERYLQRGTEFCAERDLDAQRLYQRAWLAQVRLAQGRWDEASTAAHDVLGDGRATTVARITALIALGRLRARRGDPGVWEALDEARALACAAAALQRLAPMHAARAEAAWLEGRRDDARREAEAVLPLALAKRHPVFTAELVLWCRRTGAVAEVPAFCAPRAFALEALGQWREAAQAWRDLGCPYEAARALADGDETSRREALAVFESLGARPMTERVRRQLRVAGVRGLPRGPRAPTRQHPAGLTSKEVAVLELLVAGLRNKEIAQRLARSPRTIDHHLEAIFAKLGVATRAEAVSAALKAGFVPGVRSALG